MQTAYANPYLPVAAAEPAERATFIRKTYLHLAGGILAFVALETYILNSPWVESLLSVMLRFGWIPVLVAFVIASNIADRWAHSDTSRRTQYLGLGFFIVAEAIIFTPLLYAAREFGAPDDIGKAGITTGFLVAALTITVFVTRADFSFLRGFLIIGGLVAFGTIIVGAIFDFTLGTWFAGAMVLYAAGSILYTTSKMIHHYRTDQYVAASLGLFAGIALLFWYVLQLFMSRR